MKRNTVLLIDASWYIWRAYSVLAIRRSFSRMAFDLPNLLLAMVAKDANALSATHVVLAFDGDDSFRYKIYPKYKANRHESKTGSPAVDAGIVYPEEAQKQGAKEDPFDHLAKIKKVCQLAGIPFFHIDEFEADDVLVSLATCLKDDAHVYIATKDKDLMQVISASVCMYWPGTKTKQSRVIYPKDVLEIWGVHPHQMVSLQSLIGDKIDNVPKVKGLSETVAARKIREHGSVGSWVKAEPSSKHVKLIKKQKKRVNLAHRLVKLRTDAVDVPLNKLKLTLPDATALQKLNKLLGKELPGGLAETYRRQKNSTQKGLFG